MFPGAVRPAASMLSLSCVLFVSRVIPPPAFSRSVLSVRRVVAVVGSLQLLCVGAFAAAAVVQCVRCAADLLASAVRPRVRYVVYSLIVRCSIATLLGDTCLLIKYIITYFEISHTKFSIGRSNEVENRAKVTCVVLRVCGIIPRARRRWSWLVCSSPVAAVGTLYGVPGTTVRTYCTTVTYLQLITIK
jgi:hypothetical protein